MQSALQPVKKHTSEAVEAELHNLGIELQKETSSAGSEGENPVPERTEEAIVPQLKDTGTDEIYLALEPTLDASALFRFCNDIHETGTADIAFFSSSPKGTAIKLALRNQVPFMEVLKEMAEVEEVHEDPALAIGANWGLPTFSNLRIRLSARVTLRAN